MTIGHWTIKPRPDNQQKGVLCVGNKAVPCALGKRGLTAFKREGDGKTPIIKSRALFGFYRTDRENLPRCPLLFRPIRQDMVWCDDPDHPSYNRLARLPFGASCERMWRDDALYDLVVVLDINISQRKKHGGSALFMHVARNGHLPTEGCVALDKPDLRRLLTHLSHDTVISIARTV